MHSPSKVELNRTPSTRTVTQLSCLIVKDEEKYYHYHPANEVWGKIMFLHLSLILFTGGSIWTGTPSGQVHPPGPGTPPGTKYTPRDKVHPSPLDQVHPQTRYTPQD